MASGGKAREGKDLSSLVVMVEISEKTIPHYHCIIPIQCSIQEKHYGFLYLHAPKHPTSIRTSR